MHPIKQAVRDKAIASQRELARQLGVTPGAVTQWITEGVPAERCPAIEKATKGAVRCEDLRPDVDWAYLRATNCPTPETHQEAA